MGKGDLSADLIGEILTPAASVHAIEGQSSHPDVESKTRRRSRPQEESEADNSLVEAENPPHQLDRLA